MPITFNCSCGKTLQVKDDLAGRRVRCPGCQGAATVPVPDLGFEVVDDVPPAPAPAKPAPVRAVTAERSDDEDDRPRKRRRDDEDDDRPRKRRQDDDEDDRPRGRRRDDDEDDDRPRGRRRDEDDDRSRDEDDDRPRKKKSFRKKEKAEQKPSHFGMEKRILNGGVAGGLLAMLGAVVWFVLGLMADRIFFYPPILFVIGLIAMIKGFVGGGEE